VQHLKLNQGHLSNQFMRRLFLIILFVTAITSLYAQNKVSRKKWEVVLSLDGFKARGILKSVTDSSAIIIVRKNYTDEILFRDINKIKIRSANNEILTRLAGFFIGGISGGVIIGTSLANARQGEPAALAGVIGGIGGGILVGIASALIAPQVVKLFPHKIIVVKKDNDFLASLKQQLLPYCMNK